MDLGGSPGLGKRRHNPSSSQGPRLGRSLGIFPIRLWGTSCLRARSRFKKFLSLFFDSTGAPSIHRPGLGKEDIWGADRPTRHRPPPSDVEAPLALRRLIGRWATQSAPEGLPPLGWDNYVLLSSPGKG